MMECGHAKQFWNAARDILHLKLPNLHPDTWAMDILCDTMFSHGEREKVISIMSPGIVGLMMTKDIILAKQWRL
jgi:hypothetical protein